MTYATLQRMTGPACPRCGCADTSFAPLPKLWGGRRERRWCNHCGHAWTHVSTEVDRQNGVPVVAFPRALACPECGSPRTKTTKTRRPMRYHRCLDCGARFKSVES